MVRFFKNNMGLLFDPNTDGISGQYNYKNMFITKNNGNIIVKSYATAILQIDTRARVLYKNINKYSPTTSKQTTQILWDMHEFIKDFKVIEIAPQHKCGWYLEKLMEI